MKEFNMEKSYSASYAAQAWILPPGTALWS